MGFGGNKGGNVGNLLSDFDINAIQQALGLGTQAIHNRYSQLGIGNPNPGVFGGDPATAAAAGGSLQYGSPGTAEHMDVGGLGNIAQATLGQLQTTNLNNPAIPGTPANTIFNNNQLSQLAGQAAGAAGTAAAGGGGNVNPNPGT
jgi:hypothetical protein